MRVTILASGSGGNATLIQAGGRRVLVDAGIGPRVLADRMRRAFGRVLDLDAIVLTHPHGDHVGKVVPCAKAFDATVYLSEATKRRLSLPGLRTRVFGRNAPFDVGPIRVDPMPVPHDAPQVALVFQYKHARAAIVTDLGHVPAGLASHLDGCQLVLLESNHDPGLLALGPYPEFLKRRIASSVGHLSNAQAAALMRELSSDTREIVLMHLSQKCNTPLIAMREAKKALGARRVKLRVADQDEPLDLRVSVSRPAWRRISDDQLALAF